MQTIPVYCRIWFAPFLGGAWSGIGCLYFMALNERYPVDDLDIRFYFFLYGLIGAFTGLAGWYFARLVAGRRAFLPAMALILIPAYLFILVLAVDQNPSVAAVATVSFAFILLIMILAHRSIRTRQPA
jgi:hypothetical protein